MSKRHKLQERVIAWQELRDARWLSEELPFNHRPVFLHVRQVGAVFTWSVEFGNGHILDTGGPCATLEEAKTACDSWYRFARSR